MDKKNGPQLTPHQLKKFEQANIDPSIGQKLDVNTGLSMGDLQAENIYGRSTNSVPEATRAAQAPVFQKPAETGTGNMDPLQRQAYNRTQRQVIDESFSNRRNTLAALRRQDEAEKEVMAVKPEEKPGGLFRRAMDGINRILIGKPKNKNS